MKTTKKITRLDDYLIYELVGLYKTEKRFQKFLKTHTKKIAHNVLKEALMHYSGNNILNKLEWALKYFEADLNSSLPSDNKVLFTESDKLIKNTSEGELQDSILIARLREIIGFKITKLEISLLFANRLRIHSLEEIIRRMIIAEKEVDQRLSRLSALEVEDITYAAEIK